jgi:hypothetical protein
MGATGGAAMNELTIQAAFREWFQEEYGRPPSGPAVMTHVAFGVHLLQLLELMQEVEE